MLRRNRYLPETTLAAVFLFASSVFPDDSIRVSADFEGGSANVISVDQELATISIQPATRPGRGWPCWWFVRLDGLTIGHTISLKVSASSDAYRDNLVLSAMWSQPDQASISSNETDRSVWQQTGVCHREDNTATYQFAATASTMWAAWGVPYLQRDAEELLDRLAQKLPAAERFELARTRAGRPVNGIRIGDAATSLPGHFGVWVQARQHAWEAGSSWVGQGFMEWLASDDQEAAALRRLATVYYIPIMDVDSVMMGAGGKDAIPRDHNRDWSDAPVYPEVAAAQLKISRLDEAGHFDVFVDLHNPGGSEKQPYFFGPGDMDNLPAIQQQNHIKWQAIAHHEINGPLPLLENYLFATYVKTQEESSRMSANWVRNHSDDHVLSTTLETPWNTPSSTPAGYAVVGKQLGHTLLRYLAAQPLE
ncbi:MAG: hypothetical protein KDB01_15145 [Planctomycetaceae bacterium]|nr:hypothetical protein [Planctomycetaceae bacterium]